MRRLLSVSYLIMGSVLCNVVRIVLGHGRLMEPPSRSSMWRLGYNTPHNYQDNELFCGGFQVCICFVYLSLSFSFVKINLSELRDLTFFIDFPDGGRANPSISAKNLLFGKIFAENCMKMKLDLGGPCPWHPLLVTPRC